MAATDYMASAILLPMLAGLRQASPGSRLAVFELQPAAGAAAPSDTVDLSFAPARRAAGAASAPAVSRTLRAGWPAEHPALRPGLSLETFCQLEHVIVSRTGAASARRPISRWRTSTDAAGCPSVPHFLFMLETLRNSDLVAVLPERLVRGQMGWKSSRPPWRSPA